VEKGQAVILRLQGWSYAEISLILKMSLRSIARAKQDYKQQGVLGLRLKYKGSSDFGVISFSN
jgi:transposase